MRTLTICAAAAALTLAACQRPAEEPETPMADDAAMDATSTGAGGHDGGAMTGSADESWTPAAGDAATDTTAMAPADDGMANASAVSQATRDGAKEKAEATNLHPQ